MQRDALVRINSLLGSAEDIGDVWDEFGRIATEIVVFDRCVVLAFNQDAHVSSVLYDFIPEDKTGRENGLVSESESYDLDGPVAGKIVEDRRSIILNQSRPNEMLDPFNGLGRQNITLPFLSNIGVPLIWGDRVVACIFMGSGTADLYGDDELAIAERIAAQISGPIAGAL